MKVLFFLVASLILICCSTENKNEIKVESSSDSCITKPNASFTQYVVGCSTGFYKLWSDKYVIRIESNLDIPSGECLEFKMDSADTQTMVELLIFNKGDANLTNNCTDISITIDGIEIPKPIDRVQKCHGKLVVEKLDTLDISGNKLPLWNIRIDKITFIMPETKKEIIVENELLWNVMNSGTPG